MYEAVTPRPDGASTVARSALTAAEQGYDGIVVRPPVAANPDYDASDIGDRYDVDVVDGCEVRADGRSEAAGAVQSQREVRTVVCVRGGALNRFAVEDERVDVLTRPMCDGDVNHVLARAAAENGVRLEFAFGRVLRTDGGERVQALRGLRKLREMVEQYDAPFVVSAGATSHLHLRAPRELVALGELVGFSAEQVESGLAEWGRLAERNRERMSDSFIEPGVRRGRYEEDHR
ncbi:RNase P subunit p30 family protein [Halomarina salina]|uniref:Ribonuclease P protein component 3 n=1 Tax=Halomarina salina TaxID=1872699 RepID=A0ABD5RRW6_9EURY